MNLPIPIDFNSFVMIKDKEIDLSDYYMNYAFSTEGLVPEENMSITFYDLSWRKVEQEEIVCLDAVLKKKQHILGAWCAELKGEVYTSLEIPTRNYFSCFIGANTYSMEENNPVYSPGDKLAGLNVFIFSAGTPLPDFSKIIGMSIEELKHFFTFQGMNKVGPDVKNLPDDTLVVRGGQNVNK